MLLLLLLAVHCAATPIVCVANIRTNHIRVPPSHVIIKILFCLQRPPKGVNVCRCVVFCRLRRDGFVVGLDATKLATTPQKTVHGRNEAHILARSTSLILGCVRHWSTLAFLAPCCRLETLSQIV